LTKYYEDKEKNKDSKNKDSKNKDSKNKDSKNKDSKDKKVIIKYVFRDKMIKEAKRNYNE